MTPTATWSTAPMMMTLTDSLESDGDGDITTSCS